MNNEDGKSKIKQPWWNKKWGGNNKCGITMGRLRSGNNKDGIPHVISLECGHRFYFKAVVTWLKEKNSCPMCRHTVKHIIIPINL